MPFVCAASSASASRVITIEQVPRCRRSSSAGLKLIRTSAMITSQVFGATINVSIEYC